MALELPPWPAPAGKEGEHHFGKQFHIAFRATSHEAVQEFYKAALAAGGSDNGPPGPRAHYHPAYYGNRSNVHLALALRHGDSWMNKQSLHDWHQRSIVKWHCFQTKDFEHAISTTLSSKLHYFACQILDMAEQLLHSKHFSMVSHLLQVLLCTISMATMLRLSVMTQRQWPS